MHSNILLQNTGAKTNLQWEIDKLKFIDEDFNAFFSISDREILDNYNWKLLHTILRKSEISGSSGQNSQTR